jgi:hypothetical protein
VHNRYTTRCDERTVDAAFNETAVLCFADDDDAVGR